MGSSLWEKIVVFPKKKEKKVLHGASHVGRHGTNKIGRKYREKYRIFLGWEKWRDLIKWFRN